jgi:AraC-like DNA-binding protein
VFLESAAGFASERSRALYWYVLNMRHQRCGTHYGCKRDTAIGHQIMFMTAGRGEGTYQGKHWTAQRGDAVLMDLRRPHEYYAAKKAPWEMYYVRFDGPGVAQVFDTLVYAARSPVIPYSSERRMKRDFAALIRILKSRPSAFDVWVFHHLTGLIANIAEGLQSRIHGTLDIDTPSSGIPAALALIRSEYTRTIALKELAQAACMSPFHFARQFKRQTGFTAMEYLEKFRISRAQEQILSQPNISLKQIAAQVGYSDAAYFSRIFRRRTGMPPLTYRTEGLR